MNLCTEFINYNDKLYMVYRKLREGRVKEEYLNQICEMWNCDVVVKSKNQETVSFYFLREVQDAKLVD